MQHSLFYKMLNVEVFSISFFIFGLVVIEMPDFIIAPGNSFYDYYGLDYPNMDSNYIYDETNPYHRKRYVDDDGYNTDDYKNEDDEGESSHTYPEFNLKKGKKALIEMLEDIEENYLLYEKLDYDEINDAESVERLIKAGNRCLSTQQDEELEELDKDESVQLRSKLAKFLNKFEEKLQESGYRDTTGPLTYLYTRLDNKLNSAVKEEEEEEEDDYSD